MRDGLLYVVMRVCVILLSWIPVTWSLALARAFGRGLWRWYGRGRRRALEHLTASYPDRDEAWIHQTARRSFEHIAMLAVDVLLTGRLVRRDNWTTYSTYRNVEPLKWRIQAGEGFILVTGHYGNFEMIGTILGLFGFDLYSVARPLDNRYVDRYLRRIRERHSQRIIDKFGAAELMPRIVEQGACLGLIADQDAGRKGVFVDFFGRPASTYKSIALLAITHHRPIAVGYCRRVGNRFFFEIGCNRIIEPHEWQHQTDPVQWITQEYTRAIEQFIREDPSQYWWIHRRWKTPPRQPKRNARSTASSSAPTAPC